MFLFRIGESRPATATRAAFWLACALGALFTCQEGRAAEPELRDWTDTSNQRHVRMRLLSIDGDRLTFRMADGRLAATTIAQISDADREYVASIQSRTSSRANWLTSEQRFFSVPLVQVLFPTTSHLANLQAGSSSAALAALQDASLTFRSGAELSRVQRAPATMVYARISRNFLEDFVQRTVNQCEPVNDCILGTRVVGVAKVTGQTRLVLQTDANQAVADVELVGRVVSQTVGYNGPAIIHSAGETPFEARKRLSMNEAGLQMTQKPAHAQMFSRTLWIDSWLPGLRGRLVTWIAWRRVGEKRALAEEMGAQMTAKRIGADFDREVAESIAEVRQTLESRIPALPYDHDVPHRVQFRSTPAFVEIELVRRDATSADFELQSTLVEGNPDIAIRIHQNFMGRAISSPDTRQAILSSLLELLQDREPQAMVTAFRAGDALPASAFKWSFNAGWLEIEFTDPKRQGNATR